jgi:hypothetical protein
MMVTDEVESGSDRAPPAGAKLGSVLIGAVVLVAVVGAAFAVFRMDTSGDSGSGLSNRFELDVEQLKTVDPALVHYDETNPFATDMNEVRAIAVGPEDKAHVAGDQSVRVFDLEGEQLCEMAIDGRPTCVAVGSAEHEFPGRVYVGVGDRIEVCDTDGKSIDAWNGGLDEKSVLTSIAVGEEDVFVADAGNRIVLRYDTKGELICRIGEPAPDRGVRGFVIPSPYFDVAVTQDGLLRVSNPGARRIETYTFDGDWLGHWGKASNKEIDGFFGCCNPSNFAVLEDGRFVTAEKGIPRIKVYGSRGEFQCVVAGPQTLTQGDIVIDETRDDHQVKVFDVATTSRGFVLALDPTNRTVRVFQPKEQGSL